MGRCRGRSLQTVAVMLFLAVAPAWAGWQASHGSLLVVGGTTLDFGRQAPGVLRAEVTLKNVGDTTLRIIAVRSSCGCLAVQIDREVLEPGEYATVTAWFDVSSKSGPAWKVFTIASTDPAQNTVVYNLKVEVVRPFTFNQWSLVTNARKGEAIMASPVRIRNTGEESCILTPPVLQRGNMLVRSNMTGPRERNVQSGYAGRFGDAPCQVND